MFVLAFIGILILGATGCTLIGFGHENGNGIMITAGLACLFISMLMLAFH